MIVELCVYLCICPVASSCVLANIHSWQRLPLLYSTNRGCSYCISYSLPTTQSQQLNIIQTVKTNWSNKYNMCHLSFYLDDTQMTKNIFLEWGIKQQYCFGSDQNVP